MNCNIKTSVANNVVYTFHLKRNRIWLTYDRDGTLTTSTTLAPKEAAEMHFRCCLLLQHRYISDNKRI